MPPVRREAPSKQFRYERSHEENQERAYIAASRRSDRTLEARVESARRASEIHKKRTGRALQVTEADVLNEEMYEEIIDRPARHDLLNSHYEAQHAEFDRKLLAYIGTQVATCGMLGQAISGYGQGHHSDSNTQVQPMTPQQPRDYRQQQNLPQYHHLKQLLNFEEPNHRRMMPSTQLHRSPPEHNQSRLPSVGYDTRPRPQGSPRYMSIPQGAATHYHFHHPQDQAPRGAVPYENGSVMSDRTTPQAFASQDRTFRATSSVSPLDLTRIDSAIDMANEKVNPQPPASLAAHQLPPRRHTAPFPLSTTLPPETQQLLTGSSVDAACLNTMPSPQKNSPTRKYSYNPNRRPMSARDNQTHPTSMPLMTDTQQYYPAPWGFNAGFEQSEFLASPAESITVPPTCLNDDGQGLQATLAQNPFMSSDQLSGSEDDRSKQPTGA